jgi:dihydrofolate reductase
MQRKLVLYISCSLDGYIAAPDGSLDFLNPMQKEGEDYGYADFMATVDTIIVGRKTYDSVLAMGIDVPYPDKTVYVITRTPHGTSGMVHYHTGGLEALVQDLKSRPGKNIYCDGGAEIVHELLKNNLIDEFYVSIIPTLLGNGTKLFKDGRPVGKIELIGTRSFDTGLVQLHYKRV